MPEELWSVAEVARFMGLTKMRVFQFIWAKKLPAQQIDKRSKRAQWVIRPYDVRKLAAERFAKKENKT